MHEQPSVAWHTINDLLSEDLEDLALDFIEQIVGRYSFPKSWVKLSPAQQLEWASDWILKKEAAGITPEALVERVGKLSEGGITWKR